MGKEWTYGDFSIREGLKPGSRHFQYFFVVSERGRKKCNYCVWLEDEALVRFDQAGRFDAIVSNMREAWAGWVKEKIDQGDFRNLVLKLDKQGQSEIDLDKAPEKLTLDGLEDLQ